MRPKYSNQSSLQHPSLKTITTKSKPSSSKHPKSHQSKDLLSFLGINKPKLSKKKQQLLKSQLNHDSNNTTATYKSKIKSTMLKNNQKQSIQLKQRRNQSEMDNNQIMGIINMFVVKIQRQWRVHILRQRFKKFVKSIRDKKVGYVKINSFKYNQKNQKKQRQQINNKMPYVLYQSNGQIISSYDLYKYQQHNTIEQNINISKQSSIEPLSHRSNASINQFSNIKNINNQMSKKQKMLSRIASQKNYSQSNHNKNKQINVDVSLKNKPKSQEIKIQDKIQEKEYQERRGSFDIYQQQSIMVGLNRRHSTGQIKPINNKKQKQAKSLQIDKVVNIQIKTDKTIQKQQKDHKDSPSTLKNKKNSNQQIINTSLVSSQRQKNNYDIKFPLQKILKKRKKDIQISKLKKLLSIQNRYNKNQMTYRSYLQIVKKINDDHEYKIRSFKQKQGLIISNWIELVDIGKYKETSSRFLQDEMVSNSNQPDVSMSFDKWDFHSSAKKSIDQQLELSSLGQSAKVISFQSVLKQLEEEQKKEEAQQKMFKKNKNVVPVQIINQRSKQTSQKDVSQFSVNLQQDQVNNKKQNIQSQLKNKLIQVQENKKQNFKQQQQKQQSHKKNMQSLLITPKISNSLQFQSDKALPLKDLPSSQPKNHSQSLIISEIQQIQYTQPLFSDKSVILSTQKINMTDLIFKDFKLNNQKPLNSSPVPNQNIYIQQKYSRILNEFKQLVTQKLVLNNIKIVNTVKFILARAIQDKKNKKSSKKTIQIINYPKIQTSLNGINSWLLQISHFILDNYQKIIRDNLVVVKQPPALQLIHLCKNNMVYSNIYQTIPQYVFKDFQFFFIKNSGQTLGIDHTKFDDFSTLLYTFNRCLVDCLNIALTDELITGKNWLQLPWRNDFKKKKKIQFQHAKSCLQKTINTVSNWGQYSLGKLTFQDEASQYQYKYYQSQRLNLVCRQQVNQFSLSSIFTEAYMLLQISKMIYLQEIQIFLKQIKIIQ